MPNPVVVLHVIDNLAVGGAQEIVASVVTYARHDQVVHHCAALYGPGVVGQELVSAGIPVTYLSRKRSHIWQAMWALRRLIQSVQPDIINLHLEFSTILGLVMKRRSSSVQYVTTMHALKQQLPRWFYPILRFLVHRSDRVIVEDHIAEQQIAELNYPKSRIHYIPIGTDYLDRLQARTEPIAGIRQEFAIPDAAPLILNVGRFHPAKGQAHLIRAFSSVLAQLPEARLVLVGGGQEDETLRSLVIKLGLGDRVIFPGLRRDLENFYADADVFAGTALDEGMGVVIYQAMAMKLPIVAYNAGSIEEVVQHNTTGFLVDCGNEIALAKTLIQVLDDSKHYRETFGMAGKDRIATEFSAETMVRRYEETYLHLLQSS